MRLRDSGKSKPCLVAIVGGSGSGKTWLAERLKKSLGTKALLISQDNFYRDRSHLSLQQRTRINFDNPAAIDWPLFHKVLRAVLNRRATLCPIYDFTTHCRPNSWRLIRPRRVILVDGLWLLRSPALRRLFDIRIFLECCQKTRLERRLARDLRTRGRTRESILDQFRRTVEPMHARFVEKQRKWATVVLEEDFAEKEVKTLAAVIRGTLKR